MSTLLIFPSPHCSCFRYLLFCMARHAGSSTARDYCQCNWLFQAWFDTSLLSDTHISLLWSVMERWWGTHEMLSTSYLQRNRLFRFICMPRGQDKKVSVRRRNTRGVAHKQTNRHSDNSTAIQDCFLLFWILAAFLFLTISGCKHYIAGLSESIPKYPLVQHALPLQSW